MQVYSDMPHNETSSLLRIQQLEITLEKALEEISILQSNLAYVIRVKEELEAELTVKDKREQALIKQYEKQIARKDKQIQEQSLNQEELGDLLQDVKQSLEVQALTSRQRGEECSRLERVVNEQRGTIQSLHDQLMGAKYSADLSNKSLSQDNMRVQQLQAHNEQLRYREQKLKRQLEKESKRSKRFEQECGQFKRWLGQVMGVKVIEGCQDMLMEQITARLQYSQY